MSQGTRSRALGISSRMRQRQRAFRLKVAPDTEQDGKDVMEPFEKPDKMSLETIVGPGLRVPVPPLFDVGCVLELACVS